MSAQLSELDKLRKINQALMDRVERSMDQQGQAFSLFQTAINLESQIERRTKELTNTLSRLERTNHELETAKNVAERSNLSKTHFLAAASHDVLQPLNAAQLLISSLSSVQSSDEGRRLCAQVESSLDTMTELLNSLLYMSRLDAGAVQPEWSNVSLERLFDSIQSDFEPVAKQKNIQLRMRHNALAVHSDATMLRRIIQNIVANAIDYTQSGGVLVIANHVNDRVTIRVADTGCGIAKADFDDIFVEFHRCDNQHAQREGRAGGFGLGLAIVAQMTRTLNHEIALNSRLNKGSVFRLKLLAAECPSEVSSSSQQNTQELPAQHNTLAGTRVLLIENDLTVLQAMHSLLEQWGCDVRLAVNTNEALSNVQPKNWRPHIILADQHLDEQDTGTSTIELVRTLVGSELPAVIITANPSKQLARRAASTNIDIMLKPVKPAQLRALLAHHLRVQSLS